MKVTGVSDQNRQQIEEFVKMVEKDEINDDILYNASLLMEQEEVVGIISFECFGRCGLIRYFMFKKVIDEANLSKLFDHLKENAKSKLMTHLVSFVYNKKTVPIFEFLGFFEVDKKTVYVEEKNFDTISKEATVFCYVI